MEEGGAAAGRGFWAGPEEGRGLGGAWAGLEGKVSTHLLPRASLPPHTLSRLPVSGGFSLLKPCAHTKTCPRSFLL